MIATAMRDDAEAIWTAAMRAVQPERLVVDRLLLEAGGRLCHDGQPLDPPLQLAEVDRIVVVGAGKAAAGMAAGIERLLGPAGLARHRVTGLVSVPAGCGRSLAAIEVRETRPARANLPTPAVVQATREIITAVSQLGPRDLVIAVITGGGSALLAAPKEGISLDEKIAVTRRLSESGADIATLNAARRNLSLVKGGGLARACTAGNLLAIVLSDVIGDDLDVIASGPCMPLAPATPPGSWTTPGGCHVQHVIVGDNGTAVAAGRLQSRTPRCRRRTPGSLRGNGRSPTGIRRGRTSGGHALRWPAASADRRRRGDGEGARRSWHGGPQPAVGAGGD